MAEAVETNGDYKVPTELARLQVLGVGLGVIGLAALAISVLINFNTAESALRAYLLGFCYWVGIGVGCLGILVLQHLTGGSWGLVIRRVLEAGAKTLWVMWIFVLPIVFGASQLYAWAHYQAVKQAGGSDFHVDEVLEHRAPYQNLFWFGFRSLAYFGIWSAIAYWLTRWSQEQDETGDWHISQRMNQFSGPGLVAFVVAVTFAAIDWVMVLDPHWYSTMFGLLFVIGWALSSMAFVIALMAWMSEREPMNHVLSSAHFHDLGKLMLAMVMVWAYFNFSQFLIIYSGNLPEETPWYLRRMEGGWGIVGLILVLFHFALPFLLLLSQDLKKRARILASIALFVLVMRLVDLFYLIAPNPGIENSHEGNQILQIGTIGWGVVAFLGIGGIWLTAFVWFLNKRPILPVNDPFFENALAHGREHH